MLVPYDLTAETMRSLGPGTEAKSYPEARHELFHETNREDVYARPLRLRQPKPRDPAGQSPIQPFISSSGSGGLLVEGGRTRPTTVTYGEGRDRTGDTTIFSRVLYQLSYLAKEGQAIGNRRSATLGAGPKRVRETRAKERAPITPGPRFTRSGLAGRSVPRYLTVRVAVPFLPLAVAVMVALPLAFLAALTVMVLLAVLPAGTVTLIDFGR